MIERIVIDNFKSIKHADVKLHKINVLIGPNNSGKSNFLTVFPFTNNAIKHPDNCIVSVRDFSKQVPFNFQWNKEGNDTELRYNLNGKKYFFTNQKGKT